MTNNAASLQNLHDIVELPSVPLWPPAIGGYIILSLILAVALLFVVHALIRFRRDAYRRSAIAALAALPADENALPQIASLLKRTALVAYPREQVASLTGDEWLQWLTNTSGLTIPVATGEALKDGLYGGSGVAESQALREFAVKWIRRHRSLPQGDSGC